LLNQQALEMLMVQPLRLQLPTIGTLMALWISGCGPVPTDSPQRKLSLEPWVSNLQTSSESGQPVFLPREQARREEQSKQEAVTRYPELGVAGSAVNREFVRRYKLYRAINPAFFTEPDWPTRLAAMLAQDIGLDARK
jgi:hypothetical protein